MNSLQEEVHPFSQLLDESNFKYDLNSDLVSINQIDIYEEYHLKQKYKNTCQSSFNPSYRINQQRIRKYIRKYKDFNRRLRQLKISNYHERNDQVSFQNTQFDETFLLLSLEQQDISENQGHLEDQY